MFFFFDFDNNTLPSFDQMMKPLLLALSQLGGSAQVKDIDEKAIEIMKIPDDIKLIPHKDSPNRTEVSYRLAWARTYLKKYGLIKNKARGVWSLTNKYNGNIEDIDPSEITRTVRKENSKEEESNSLSGIGSAQAFENLVLSTLRDRVNQQDKHLYLAYSDTMDFGYDVDLPDGIDSLDGHVYCIIKYIQMHSKSIIPMIKNTLLKVSDTLKSGTVLFILNIILPSEEKEKIENIIFSETKFKIIIWDKMDLSQKVDPESNYANYLINPKQALIEDTLFSDLTDEEKQKRRNEHIEKVKLAYRNQDITLFLGAGVSIGAGIPLWSGLIRQLLIHMINSKTREKKLTPLEQKVLNEFAYNNKEDSPLTQMRYIKSAFSDEEYYNIVHKVLYSNHLNTNTALLDAIARISTPHRSYNGIKSIVTYNFDDLLERKFGEKEVEHNTVYCENDMASNNKLNIYHVHGYLPSKLDILDGEPNLVFSEEDYHRVYRDAYSWSNLMQLNAFRDSTCLFIGCSLTDPNLRRLLDVAARNGENPRHYVFLQKNRISMQSNSKDQHKDLLTLYQRIDDNIREGYFRELGLNIIWVDEYEEIPEILLELLK